MPKARELSQIRKRLLRITDDTNKLVQSELFLLKSKVEEGSKAGRDLLQEMAATIGKRISEAKARLQERPEENPGEGKRRQ